MDVEQRLNGYLDEIERAVKGGSEFVQEQAPLVVQELLAWHFWSAVFWFVVLTAAVGICFYVGKRLAAKAKTSSDPDLAVLMVWIIPVVLMCIMSSAAVHAAYRVVKVTVAPRLIVLEEVQRLVRR